MEAIESVTSVGVPPTPAHPPTLAGFAAFVRDECLADYVHMQLEGARIIDIPMMRHMQGVPLEALEQRSTQGALEFLTHLADGYGDEYIQLTISRWRRDELGVVGKWQIDAADITGINLIRKRACLALLPRYTSDLEEALAITAELDSFIHKNETAAFNLLTVFHEELAASRQEFIERVSAAVPGTLYVYDLTKGAFEYINDHLSSLLGYNSEELLAMGADAQAGIIHPDDRAEVAEYFRRITDLRDGEVRSHKHRSIRKDGSVLWIRSYDTPFRRAADGTITQLVGFSFDITTEKLASESLKEREAQMHEAQAIARLGSYVQDLSTGISRGTPQLAELLRLSDLNDWDAFAANVHPDDREDMLAAFKATMEVGVPYNHTYRYADGYGGWKHLSARGILETAADGRPTAFRGTVQDVTEQESLLRELSEKERLYREAQAIARMGSWAYEIGAAQTFWSTELLHIYGIDEPSGLKDRDRMRGYTVLKDRERVRYALDESLAAGESGFEIRYSIETAAGEVKHLHSRGTFVKDVHGTTIRVMGTVQDVTEQQALIDRLAESRARYKEAQAIARIGNWSHDLDHDVRRWSDEMFRLFGIDRVEQAPTAREFAALLHPADRARLLRRHKLMRDMPGTYSAEYRVDTGTHDVRWIHMRTESVAGPDGRVNSLRGTVQDITPQKEAEQRSLQQETFIRKVTDLAPSVITVFDVKAGTYEFVNEGLHALLGYDAEAMLRGGPEFVLGRCHPDDLPVLHAFAEKVMSAGASAVEDTAEAVHEERYRLRNAEGEYRWIHTYATIFNRGEDGSVEKTLDISLDVTGQMEAETAARENERFVQNVTQLVPSVITVVDVDTGRYVFVNETGASILGQPAQRFLEEGVSFMNSLAHPDDVPGMTQAFAKAVQDANAQRDGASETVSEMQFRIRDADGSYRWMRALSTPFLRKPDGVVQQMITITQDVTALHQAEEVLRTRAVKLQQSNAALEEFAYVASHDLQEPLRKISTFGDMLQKSGGVADERGAAYLTKMIDSAKRMQTLINDLLDISVISRQKSFENASLNLLLREVLQTLEHKIEDTGAVIEADRLPDAVVIPAQIRQLFQNLLSNALKFRRPDEAPRITITATGLFARDAQALGLLGHQPYIKIEFQDTGIGFSNEYADKIFAIFQRLHGRSEYEGSGIGLAICKKIAEHHGGTVWASGEVGVGAVFTLVLPI